MKGDAVQQLANHGSAVGVPQEYCPFIVGRYVTITDTRLVSVAEQWLAMPETLRDEVVKLCMQSWTGEVSRPPTSGRSSAKDTPSIGSERSGSAESDRAAAICDYAAPLKTTRGSLVLPVFRN